MGLAGSVSLMFCEISFHFVDTVNIRTKASDKNISMLRMLNRIFSKEGIYGLSKGITAAFYGSILCGFMYFTLYKKLKHFFKELFGEKVNIGFVFFSAAFISEFVTLGFYYPFDLIKSRLQTRNYHFKYKNLPHAFRKEISKNGVLSLYRGALPFLATYTCTVSIQFTVYELLIAFFKQRDIKFSQRELAYIVLASFAAGGISSSCMTSVVGPLIEHRQRL